MGWAGRAMVTTVCGKCGIEFVSYRCNARKFCSEACGNSAKGRRHGESRTRLHVIWCKIKARCNPASKSRLAKKYYSERGITVCDEWASSYEAFRDWAIANGYSDGLEIDRIDNDKGYRPDNCRWATRHQQMQNTRKSARGETSEFRGVSWSANHRKWRAQIRQNGKTTHIGVFASEEEAARAYDAEALARFGQFASLNFKQGGVPS